MLCIVWMYVYKWDACVETGSSWVCKWAMGAENDVGSHTLDEVYSGLRIHRGMYKVNVVV